MKLLAVVLNFVCLMAAAGVVRADHMCTNSPNEVVVGMSPAGNGVASVPICRWLESAEQAPAPPPKVVERWEVFDDRFGAWATEPSTGALGVSYGELSAEAAERKAVEACLQKGGKDCRSFGSFRNACSTVAWGRGYLNMDGAETIELSERRSVQGCEEKTGGSCDVIQTVCSLAASRWVYDKPDNFGRAR